MPRELTKELRKQEDMNAENFKDFLENPSRLYQLSYQELKSLVLQYPYSTNLHYLLLQKSGMENHRELVINRQRAATYSLDRTRLYRLIRDLASLETKEPILQLDEEFLELKDLSFLEVPPPAVSASGEMNKESPPSFPFPVFPSLSVDVDVEEEENLDTEIDFGLDLGSPPGPEVDLKTGNHPQEPEDTADLLDIIQPKAGDVIGQAPGHSQAKEPLPAPYSTPRNVIDNAIAIASLSRLLLLPTGQTQKDRVVTAPIAPSPDLPAAKSDASTQKEKLLFNKLDDLLATQHSEILSVHHKAAIEPPDHRKPAPRPKGTFNSWAQQYQAVQARQQLSEIVEIQKQEELKKLQIKKNKTGKKKKKADKDQHIIQFAEQSLAEDQSLVSETLAELLAGQGLVEKSIKMYERLMLYFPEKSAYFAAIIEKLKNK